MSSTGPLTPERYKTAVRTLIQHNLRRYADHLDRENKRHPLHNPSLEVTKGGDVETSCRGGQRLTFPHFYVELPQVVISFLSAVQQGTPTDVLIIESPQNILGTPSLHPMGMHSDPKLAASEALSSRCDQAGCGSKGERCQIRMLMERSSNAQ